MNTMVVVLALFIVMYALLLIFSEKRWIIALAAAAIFMVLGILSPVQALRAINWNVLMMLTGTMMIVELFIQSKMPSRMAEGLLKAAPNVQWAIVALSLFSGIISAFVDNVATVLMVAPVGLAVARRVKTNPVPVIIAIAVSSNLQGAATLVGDTTSILLGSYAKMTFNDFFWFHGKPGITFAVETGALLTIPVLLWLFRKETARIEPGGSTRVTDYVPTMLLVVNGIAAALGIEPYLFDFGLLIGATLGGNITPIGASANIAGIGILQKTGYKVTTKDFIRIGIPFTLIAAISGALVIWLVWA